MSNIEKEKGINTSLDYDFNSDPNKNINDVSINDRVIYSNNSNKDEDSKVENMENETNNQIDSSSKLETNKQYDTEGNRELNTISVKDDEKIEIKVESKKNPTRETINNTKESIINPIELEINNTEKEKLNEKEIQEITQEDEYILPSKSTEDIISLQKTLKEKQ